MSVPPADEPAHNEPAGARPLQTGSVEARLRVIVEQSPMAIHIVGPDGRSLLANHAWNELWCLGEDERPEGRNVFDDEQLRDTGLLPYVRRALAGEAAHTAPLLFDPARAGREGPARWVEARVSPVLGVNGEVREVTLMLEDVTGRKELENRLKHQAHHDQLTGLPNRALLMDRLQRALDGSGPEPGPAILFLDLDNFKYVNDSMGHDTGDELLIAVARRLRENLASGDTVARIGGDEFAVLLGGGLGGVGSGAALKIAHRLAAELRRPFAVGDREVFAAASLGVAVSGENGTAKGAEELLGNADLALYWGKANGKGRCETFEPSMDRRSRERLEVEVDLRRAVEKVKVSQSLEDLGAPGGATDTAEFSLHYQPQIGLSTGEISGAEALLRWEHPERGYIPPGEFIPLAEEIGAIVPLGREVIRAACRELASWRRLRQVADSFTMSVNISARQLREPGFVGEVEETLRETALEPGLLCLELTEGALVDDTPEANDTLAALGKLGVRLAIDDFGTGYSSLSYLGRLPADVVKLDRALVAGVERDRATFTILLSTVTLAHTLGLRVVAEGVESPGAAAKLRALKCDVGQGYYWSRPLPALDMERLLAGSS